MLEKNLINLQDKFTEFIGVFSPHAPTPLETEYHPNMKNSRRGIEVKLTQEIKNYNNNKFFISRCDYSEKFTSRTGPFTFLMMDLFGSSRNSTLTCVTLPVLPVRPSTLLTFASFTG